LLKYEYLQEKGEIDIAGFRRQITKRRWCVGIQRKSWCLRSFWNHGTNGRSGPQDYMDLLGSQEFQVILAYLVNLEI
jgi:hypothetical protein